MKLVMINGSPRYKKSNSKILIEQFLSGYHTVNPASVPVSYLAGSSLREEAFQSFQEAETAVIVFPLYTDSMPGIVMEFFEKLHAPGAIPVKKIGFIVQSGFPESIHSAFAAKYLGKLSRRLGCEYLGTVIKGGVEGIQMMPPSMTKKLFSRFQELGRYFAEHRAFSPDITEELAKPYKMSALRKAVFRVILKIGIGNFYWNSNLKKNGAYEDRFARPFL